MNRVHKSRLVVVLLAVVVLFAPAISDHHGGIGYSGNLAFAGETAPAPLLKKGHPVDWWFVFKFNAATFPGCEGGAERTCLFGGTVQDYRGKYSQQYVYASSKNPTLQKGGGCAGDTLNDPIGATFNQVYNNSYYYVLWNDQFYEDPKIKGCTKSCGSPWGHSKGMLSWNDADAVLYLMPRKSQWIED